MMTIASRARLRALTSWRLTLLGRSLLLFASEIALNLLIWIIALLLWAPDSSKRNVLSLAVIAWTLGLRHGLDMDHITVIDNVTRALVSRGRAPVTVGLFFSLGHSSLVVGVTVAIVISVSTIDKLPDVASVGGVIGISVSASLLFVLALLNSIFLYRALQSRKKQRLIHAQTPQPKRIEDEEKGAAEVQANDEQSADTKEAPSMTCLTRIARPLLRLVDEPWKLFPIGVVFSFGFDTSSEIALLGVSALAKSGTSQIPNSEIVLLPLLFTAGMTFVDSCDSIFMVYAYTAPERMSKHEGGRGRKPTRWQLVERLADADEGDDKEKEQELPTSAQPVAQLANFSIALTVLSIVIALLISITEFMGLALEKCGSCGEAADNDPGLSGQWWRFWARLNDNSGYLGAGVVGLFLLLTLGWLGVRRVRQRRRERGERQAGVVMATSAR